MRSDGIEHIPQPNGAWHKGTDLNIKNRPISSIKRSNLPQSSSRGITCDERALSHPPAALLMIAITVILAVVLFTAILGMIPFWSWMQSPSPPPITVIDVNHTSTETGKITWASRIYLLNNGSTTYINKDLEATFYKGGFRVAYVSTLNGHLLIQSHHHGVRYIAGEGCRGIYWRPGEVIEVDLADYTFISGNKITVEIRDKLKKKVISRYTLVV